MTNLPQILKAVDWQKNIDNAFFDNVRLQRLESALLRTAIWSKQLENADAGNPALCFVREMQISIQQGAALIGLSLYKSSASCARSMVETCLYYSYFRTHLEELATLVRVEKYYITKSDIIDYHKVHTKDFMSRQDAVGLIGNLEKWYSKVSAVVHGQIPGIWNNHDALDKISFNEETNKAALEIILTAEKLVHHILLCTVGNHYWSSLAPDAKSQLVKGMTPDQRTQLGLDAK